MGMPSGPNRRAHATFHDDFLRFSHLRGSMKKTSDGSKCTTRLFPIDDVKEVSNWCHGYRTWLFLKPSRGAGKPEGSFAVYGFATRPPPVMPPFVPLLPNWLDEYERIRALLARG
jgi:hypothetical protein